MKYNSVLLKFGYDESQRNSVLVFCSCFDYDTEQELLESFHHVVKKVYDTQWKDHGGFSSFLDFLEFMWNASPSEHNLFLDYGQWDLGMVWGFDPKQSVVYPTDNPCLELYEKAIEDKT